VPGLCHAARRYVRADSCPAHGVDSQSMGYANGAIAFPRRSEHDRLGCRMQPRFSSIITRRNPQPPGTVHVVEILDIPAFCVWAPIPAAAASSALDAGMSIPAKNPSSRSDGGSRGHGARRDLQARRWPRDSGPERPPRNRVITCPGGRSFSRPAVDGRGHRADAPTRPAVEASRRRKPRRLLAGTGRSRG